MLTSFAQLLIYSVLVVIQLICFVQTTIFMAAVSSFSKYLHPSHQLRHYSFSSCFLSIARLFHVSIIFSSVQTSFSAVQRTPFCYSWVPSISLCFSDMPIADIFLRILECMFFHSYSSSELIISDSIRFRDSTSPPNITATAISQWLYKLMLLTELILYVLLSIPCII